MVLKLFQKKKYSGSRDAEEMIEYILNILPYKVIELTSSNYADQISSEEYSNQPWLVISCKESDGMPNVSLKNISFLFY